MEEKMNRFVIERGGGSPRAISMEEDIAVYKIEMISDEEKFLILLATEHLLAN